MGEDAATDLAVVQVEEKDLPVATFGDSDTLQVGEPAIAIGNALGYGQSTTVGYIGATERTVTINNAIVLHAIEEQDFATENFFRKFVDEQVEEEALFGDIVDKLKKAGDSGVFFLDAELATRK